MAPPANSPPSRITSYKFEVTFKGVRYSGRVDFTGVGSGYEEGNIVFASGRVSHFKWRRHEHPMPWVNRMHKPLAKAILEEVERNLIVTAEPPKTGRMSSKNVPYESKNLKKAHYRKACLYRSKGVIRIRKFCAINTDFLEAEHRYKVKANVKHLNNKLNEAISKHPNDWGNPVTFNRMVESVLGFTPDYRTVSHGTSGYD